MKWKIFPLMLVSLCLAKDNGLHYVDLIVEEKGRQLSIEPSLVLLADWPLLQDRHLKMHKELRASLDGPFQAALRVIQEMDAVRDERIKFLEDMEKRTGVKSAMDVITSNPDYIVGFTFTLAVRDLRGRVIDKHESHVRLGLSTKRGHFLAQRGMETVRQATFQSLEDKDGFTSLLDWMISPGSLRLKKPSTDTWILDLYYDCDYMDMSIIKRYGLSKTVEDVHILGRVNRMERHEQLGTTYRYVEDNEVRETRSGHLNFLRKLIDQYASIREKLDQGEDVMQDLEELVAMAPTETGLLALLAKNWSMNGQRDRAYEHLRRLEPLILKSPDTAQIYREIKAIREGERRKLMARRDQFRKDENIKLRILSPSKGDFIGGDAEVVFNIEGAKSRLIQADLLINGKHVKSIHEGPHAISFKPDGERKHLGIKVMAWFRDKTYQEAKVNARYIFIGQEAQSQMISLRTVANKGGSKFLVGLEKKDFTIEENGVPRNIERFRRDTAPLRIAVLMDTSGSMVGEKLYKAQYAVNSFLNKLSEDDAAAVYAFDHKVLRFASYTNDFGSLKPYVFTMRPQMTTSLHDAVMGARDDLRDMDGTKVIIVLSDGKDSTSKTDSESLKYALKYSNVLVYSIIIDEESELDKQGADFLDELAEITGCITTRLKYLSGLDKAFERIYNELKSFYFLDFYSNQEDFDRDNVYIKVHRNGAKARFRQHLNEEDLRRKAEREMVSMPVSPPRL